MDLTTGSSQQQSATRLFAPDPSFNPGVTDPAQSFVNPQADPGKQRANNLPGFTDQTDFELQVIGNPDAKCDPNSADVRSLPTIIDRLQNTYRI